MSETEHANYLIQNDAVVLGILLVLLALIFFTSNSSKPVFKKFYSVVPMLLLCYFLPSLLTTFNIVDGENSQLYFVASRYLLPACLVLLTLSIDLKEVFKLGSKALIMFLTGTFGVIIGGPLAILITSAVNPDLVGGAGPEAIWRGMTTIAGSWIGGGANQAAMYEIFKPSDQLYSVMITVDVLVAEVWMAVLLIGVGKSKQIDKYFRADASSVTHLKDKMHEFSQKIARIPTSTDLMVILAIGIGVTGISHLTADWIAPFIETHAPSLYNFSLTSLFFWLIILSTTIGIGLSFTKLRQYEGAGASKIGTVFIYILVATIGMKMDISKIFENIGLFAVGGIWMAIHVILLLIVGKLIRAPYFFLAVGSKANIGGAAQSYRSRHLSRDIGYDIAIQV